MARALELMNGSFAMVDDDDYERLSAWQWNDCVGSYIYTRQEGVRIYLNRAVMGNPQGMFVSSLDGDYRNCRKDNLFVYDPSTNGARIAARKVKLRDLWIKGVDVTALTKTFKGPGPKQLKETGNPESFALPDGAPEDVKAIRTKQGTLVYVDCVDYDHLNRPDWRDTGKCILRSSPAAPIRLARLVANSLPDEMVGYFDGNYHHCWRDNLYYYHRGHRAAGRNESLSPGNRRLPVWVWAQDSAQYDESDEQE